MIGQLITAGASLLGGLFGSNKKTTSSVDYVKMAANATKAGFNPLTAIRNGGSAGFTTTTSSDMSSLGGALQALGGPLGEAMSKKFDPVEQKKRQLDTALVDYQLRQLQQGPKAMPGQLYPGGQSSGVKVNVATPTMAPRKIAPYLEEGKLMNTDPWAWTGGVIKADPNRSDGANYEDAYGDFMGGALGGAVPFVQDAWHNVKRAWSEAERLDRERYRKFKEAKKPASNGWWVVN